MCLDNKGTFKPCKVGYKIMRRDDDGELTGEYRSLKPRKVGAWLDEASFRGLPADGSPCPTTNDSGSPYPYGFHVYNIREDAESHYDMFCLSHRHAIVKVAIRNPLAVGYEGCSRRRVTVAKQIKILPDKK